MYFFVRLKLHKNYTGIFNLNNIQDVSDAVAKYRYVWFREES